MAETVEMAQGGSGSGPGIRGTAMLAAALLPTRRILVMKDGRVIESGLTDQVLDEPREPCTQLLVSSILPA